MKKLLKLNDHILGLGNSTENISEYKEESSVKAVIFNKENKIALLYVKKDGFYKLPGGGVESGESLDVALAREVHEEVGCEIEIIKELGEIEEYYDQIKLKKISYGYVAQMTGGASGTAFTDNEKSLGFELQWLDFKEAVNKMKNNKPDFYRGKFIWKRDMIFIQEALKVMNNL